MLTDPSKTPPTSLWSYATGAVLALLGALTMVWTRTTLDWDFGSDLALRIFAVGTALILHGVLLAMVARAALARWDDPRRNSLAMAAVGGYILIMILYAAT